MKFKNRILVTVVACLSASALVFATAPAGNAAVKKLTTIKIAAVVKGLDNPYFVSVKAGIVDTAKALGVTVNVQVAPGLNDDIGQTNVMDALASQNYDCYIVIPVTGNNLSAALGKVTKKGKPIINIDTPVDAASLKAAGGKITSFASTDNFAAGVAGGKAMIKLIGSGQKIALIAGLAGNVTSNQRIDGFKKGAAGSTFVGPINADWDTTKALDTANQMLVANPDIKAFFAANDQMAQGVAKAIAAAGKKIPVYGVDGIMDNLNLIKAGSVTASISQYPYVMGKMGVEACIIAAQGGKVPAFTVTPHMVIDSSNIDAALKTKNQTPPGGYKDPYVALIKK
ncbi:MAG: sugar ABC transporter substrate-binding protein [Streptomycetaceae bacterium]|nr:MAG: sugar ABC transporter substrate-binding protein [Streptomycetaceae bacterium]